MPFVLQYIVYFVFHFPAKFFLRAEIHGLENTEFNRRKPLIIAANHPSRIDPFLFVLLPFHIVRKLVPFYAPTYDGYYKQWWFSPLVWFGALQLRDRAWTMEELFGPTLKRLARGGKVILFPQGQIASSDEKLSAKPGVIYLSKESRAEILPLRIDGIWKLTFKDFILRRRSVRLIFGKPTHIESGNSREELKESANRLMELVLGLNK